MKTPRFRVHQWVDLTNRVVLFGIQERVAPRKWIHFSWGSGPVLYDDRELARYAVEELSMGRSICHLPQYTPPPPVIEPDPEGAAAYHMAEASKPV